MFRIVKFDESTEDGNPGPEEDSLAQMDKIHSSIFFGKFDKEWEIKKETRNIEKKSEEFNKWKILKHFMLQIFRKHEHASVGRLDGATYQR